MKRQKSLTEGGLYYLLYNVLNIAFPFLTGIYVSRCLLPSGIGAFAAAKNLAQYFVILAFLGLPTYGMREMAKVRDPGEARDQLFSELFVINFISTVVFLGVYLALISTVAKYRNEYSLYLITGISVAANALNITWLYEGLEEYRFISLRNIACKAGAFLLLLLFVRNETHVLRYALITVLGNVANHAINVCYAPRYVRFRRDHLNLRKHMKSIMYLVAVNLAIELYSLIDVTMMNFLCSRESIAFYQYGHTIEQILIQVVNTFTWVLIPRLSHSYEHGELDAYNRLISKAFRMILICSIPMMIGIWFTSDVLVTIMYGPVYIASARILKLFSVLLLISPTGYLLGSRVLLVSGHENQMVYCVGLGAIVNFIGNCFLIPRMQEMGATFASVISEIVVMVTYVHLGKRYFHLQGIMKTLLRVLAAASLITVYLAICQMLIHSPFLKTFIQVAGSICLYFIALIVMREPVSREYWQIIRNRVFGRKSQKG